MKKILSRWYKYDNDTIVCVYYEKIIVIIL